MNGELVDGKKSEPGDAPRVSGEMELIALGSDPFDEVVESDPFLEGLASLGLAPRAGAPPLELASPRVAPVKPTRPTAVAPVERPPRLEPAPEPTPLLRHRAARTPELAEIDIPEVDSWIDRLIAPADRQRLAAVAHLVEGEQSYDRFGLAPDVMKRAFPFFHALHRAWFRVKNIGVERLPRDGPAILAANHGGLLPFDGAMIVLDVVLSTDPPRLPRAIVDRWAGSLPWVNIFYARVGQVVGTRENFADLLADRQLLLVFPEGMEGVRKPVNQRYRLQRFHVGFVEQALRARAPVVPVGVIGSDDQTPILYDFRGLAKRLGLPALPITPTFPWFGPLGLLPYPVPYTIVYGEPMCFHERFGPEDADDARLVQYLAKQVREEVQHLLDRHR